MSVVGILQDETDPMVSVMKVEKAPLESYADVGGLEQQITEIKEAVELPLTHPELYEDIGIKPPKVWLVASFLACRYFTVLPAPIYQVQTTHSRILAWPKLAQTQHYVSAASESRPRCMYCTCVIVTSLLHPSVLVTPVHMPFILPLHVELVAVSAGFLRSLWNSIHAAP